MFRGSRGFGSRGFSTRNPLMRTMPTSYAGSGAEATYGTFLFKFSLLVAVMLLMGSFAMSTVVNSGEIAGGIGLIIASPIIGFISVIVAMRSMRFAPYAAFVYAIFQGLFLGTISGVYEILVGDGIVATALMGTVGVLFAMLLLYQSGLIRVTDRFRKVMFTALMGLIFAMFLFFVLALFGLASELAFGYYLVIIGISVVVASLFLVIDFDNIQMMIDSGSDARTEWMFALSLLVTIVWLYIELLRLLMILSQRRR